ncbi:hypothetical protein [Duganella sp. BuS-21]|uniref:hypothetical protein n=1 Tax=Duganella sp. BuS-21 TaxID=2943848 RepID=UPI0035A5A6BA
MINKKDKPSDFDGLVLNGIDFLEKAITQLNIEPKYSVINFYTAVEILLKAPLVKEHWYLVVVGKPDRQAYEAGNFMSVSFDEACDRLASSLKKPLAASARKAFDAVREHRNRMVHFYHTGIDGKQREAIKLEQAQAWFELNRFVTDVWRDEFKPYLREFRRMESGLIANNHYAKAKYESLKNKIEGMKKGGATFELCPSCGTDACITTEPADRLRTFNCLVCFYTDTVLEIDCPQCGSKQQLKPYEGFICSECEHAVPEDGIFDLVDECVVRGTKDDFDSNTPANCDECQGYHTVCEFGDGYLCSNCFSYFDTLSSCGWCNDPRTTHDEDSYVTGCEFCEGYAGHHAND